jgi:hypothetical protein
VAFVERARDARSPARLEAICLKQEERAPRRSVDPVAPIGSPDWLAAAGRAVLTERAARQARAAIAPVARETSARSVAPERQSRRDVAARALRTIHTIDCG